jgi:hypothetical protein
MIGGHTTTTESLGLTAMRALHSYAIDACYGQADHEVGGAILYFLGGGTYNRFVEAVTADQFARAQVLVDHERGRTFIRLLVREDTANEWSPVCYVPAARLGIDETAFATIVAADAAAFGLDVEDLSHLAPRLEGF